MPNVHMSFLTATLRSPSRWVWRIDGSEGSIFGWAELRAIHQVNEEFACCELFGEVGTPWAQGGVCIQAVEPWLQLTRLHGARNFYRRCSGRICMQGPNPVRAAAAVPVGSVAICQARARLRCHSIDVLVIRVHRR